jgi:N-acetylglucosaminyldiphosphoundecaprenol N-acetyl-beta-D-mannosaminyltransferase
MADASAISGDTPAVWSGQPVDSASILGAPISVVTLPKVLSIFERWSGDDRDRIVLLRDVHGAMRARSDPAVRDAQDEADLVLPDGMPLVWAVRLTGQASISRVCGIDLFPAACQHGVARGWRHYLYGASPGVAEKLADMMRERCPGIEIVGTYCPPFRPLTSEEDEEACAKIRAARPDFVWVSLSTPKQDLWMREHRGRCGGATMVGVGGAFEINAGLIPRAPLWMQKSGLEWLFRLWQEPERLGKRYFNSLPLFVVLTSIELFKGYLSGVRPGRPVS